MVSLAAGIIGCGVMGTALGRRLIASGEIIPANLWLFDMDRQKLNDIASELGAEPAENLEQLFQQCRNIFVAVKPQDVKSAAGGWAELFQPAVHLLISLAAGVTIGFYEEHLPAGSKVIRLMPNTPSLIGEGAVAMSTGKAVTSQEAAEIGKLLGCLGLVVPVDEQNMDVVTGLSGSGPAYVYLFIETLIDAGVNLGLSRETAAALAVQTVLGAARMVRESGRHPVELRNDVTSPAGTTAAALEALETGRFRGALLRAVKAAAQRSGELSDD